MAVTSIKTLQLNKKYPSYQLYAIAGTPQMDPDEVFKTCILYTYRWLRARFGGFELTELDVPEPAEAGAFELSSISSFSITDPYPVEVIWLPDDKVWSLKLTEPDNGNEATDYRPAREAVAGRLFETNIGYRITDKGVECGFKTIVSEPEGIDEPVESFRLACIKDVARDPGVGLYHGYKLQDEPVSVASSAEVKKLVRWIKSDERQLPVIISDLGTPKAEKKEMPAMPSIEEFLAARPLGLRDSLAQISGLKPPAGVLPEPKEQSSGERVDIRSLARYMMGYAQYFVVTKEMSELMCKEFRTDYKQGDFNVFEPSAFGGRVRSYNAFSSRSEARLDSFASAYPAKKPMTFGDVLFANDARELSSKHIAELAESKEALAQAYEERIAAINAKHEDEISSYRAKLDDEIRENQRLEKVIENIQAEITKNAAFLEERHKEELKRHAQESEDARRELERYQTLERRPADIQGISAWVESEFAGKLILHERAQKLLADLKPGESDAALICDALEFLATDYRDELTGAITETQMQTNCSRKYGRPFDVTPLRFVSAAKAPKEYKIKYRLGHTGKPTDSLLDLHLRVGNTTEDLLRIYFLYDKDKKLIVVGSLPKHLPTWSYK